MPASPEVLAQGDLRRARIATSFLKVTSGVLVGGWISRVPDVRAQAGVDDAQWGLANSLDTAAGLLILGALLFVIGRVNVRLLSVISAAALLALSAALGFASNPLTLITLMIIYGVANNIGETPTAALEIEVQRRYGRPLLGSFVACWSGGNFAGGAVGTASAALAIPISQQFVATSLVLGTGLAVVCRWLPEASPPARTRKTRIVLLRINPQLGLIAALSLLTAVVGSIGEVWSATYIAETLLGGAVLGAVAVTSISIANTCGTLLVDRLIARFGMLRTFMVATTLAVGGAILVLLAPSAGWGIAGFLVVGLGTAAVAPMLLGTAAAQPETTAGEGAAIVQLGAAPAWMLTPLAVGFAAQQWGLHHALVILPCVLAAQLAIAPLIRGARLTSAPRSVVRPDAPT